MYRIHKIIAGIFFLTPLCAMALPSDVSEKIHIIADSSVFNYKTGETVYEGNVKVDQGTTHLTADKVVIKNNDQHKIETAIAYGNNQPAQYSTLPKPGDTLMQAKAKVIKYFPTKTLIQLEGDVEVLQGENSFHGPLILYNMKDQIVSAPASKTGRATIVIDPSKLKS
jgi:lipopolysaccharide export system protein LptA